MNQFKLAQTIRSFMARRGTRNGKKAILESLRVQLIPVRKENLDVEEQRDVVRHLLSAMVLNSRKRGRPKKSEEGELKYAL